MIEQTEGDVSVELDKQAPRSEFAVYLDGEIIFSRLERGRMPEPLDIIPAIRARRQGTSG